MTSVDNIAHDDQKLKEKAAQLVGRFSRFAIILFTNAI